MEIAHPERLELLHGGAFFFLLFLSLEPGYFSPVVFRLESVSLANSLSLSLTHSQAASSLLLLLLPAASFLPSREKRKEKNPHDGCCVTFLPVETSGRGWPLRLHLVLIRNRSLSPERTQKENQRTKNGSSSCPTWKAFRKLLQWRCCCWLWDDGCWSLRRLRLL